jgi:hypothetical protein
VIRFGHETNVSRAERAPEDRHVNASTQDIGRVKKTDEVEILVNNKAVSVPKHTSGAEIKSRAGVPATFELFEVEGKKEEPVADDDKVTVKEGDRFIASPSLDPS